MSLSFRKSAVLGKWWGGPPGLLGTRPSRSYLRGIRFLQPSTSRGAQSIVVKIRPFRQSQAAWRDVAQTLLSAAPRPISALLVPAEEARQECRAGRLSSNHLLEAIRQTIDSESLAKNPTGPLRLVGHALVCPEKAWASPARRDKLKHVLPKNSAVVSVARGDMSESSRVGVVSEPL
jgi:hypothetical protein